MMVAICKEASGKDLSKNATADCDEKNSSKVSYFGGCMFWFVLVRYVRTQSYNSTSGSRC